MKIRRVQQTQTLQKKLRVAAYARVSVDALHHSLAAQVSYYSSLIQKNPAWEYAGVYADEGITGTSTTHRTEFKRLIADCNAGKIDLVLVKSISRFARDTVDCLHTVRRLKEKGIAVRFERENIDSTSEDGDVLRSDLIQCNDRVRAVRPLGIWVLARWLLLGSLFVCSEIGDSGAVGCILY